MLLFAVSFFHQMCSVTCAGMNFKMEAQCSAHGSVDFARRGHCFKQLICSNPRPVLERLVGQVWLFFVVTKSYFIHKVTFTHKVA